MPAKQQRKKKEEESDWTIATGGTEYKRSVELERIQGSADVGGSLSRQREKRL